MAKKRTPHKVRRHRKVVTRWRGKRSKERERISRVYSERPETRAISPMVAYKPYETEQPISLESTAIHSMGYDPKTNLLWITFWGYKQKKKGSTYVYKVPETIWIALNEAGSKGRYFYYFIRTIYKYTRVR